MLLFVLYACLRLLIDLGLAPLRDRAAEQAELLLLRHHVRVLERQVKVVHWRQADPLILAPLARRLPKPSWSTLLVKPETVLGWHRELVRRKWASFAGRPRRGRPSISEECRELIHQMAKENAGWGLSPPDMRQGPFSLPAQRRASWGELPSTIRLCRRAFGRFHSIQRTWRSRRRSQLSILSNVEGSRLARSSCPSRSGTG